MAQKHASLHNDNGGHSIIELAVVLPVLLMIGLGVFEVSNFVYQQHLVVNGVRDGARFAAGLPYDSANTSQIASVSAAAKSITTTGEASGGTARVSGWGVGAVTVTYSTVANGATSCGSTRCYRPIGDVALVTVSTSTNFQDLGFLGFLGLGAITLSASHQERVIGVR